MFSTFLLVDFRWPWYNDACFSSCLIKDTRSSPAESHKEGHLHSASLIHTLSLVFEESHKDTHASKKMKHELGCKYVL